MDTMRQNPTDAACGQPRTVEFVKILAAYAGSSCANHLLPIALAALTLQANRSHLEAALTLVLNYAPSVLVSGRIGPFIDRHGGRSILASLELISAFLSICCAALAGTALYVVIAVRAMVATAAKAAYGSRVKQVTDGRSLQARRSKMMTLAFFLSKTAAGLLAGLLLSWLSGLVAVVAMVLLLYAWAIVWVWALRPLPAGQVSSTVGASHHLGATLTQIWTVPVLREGFAVACLAQAIFQSAYHNLLLLQPYSTGLGAGGIALYQLAAGVGLGLGFSVALTWSPLTSPCGAHAVRCFTMAAVALLALVLTACASDLWLSLTAFAAALCLYEFMFLDGQARFFSEMPRVGAGRYQHALSACGGALMSVFALSYALASEWTGIPAATLTYVTAAALLVSAAAAALARARAVDSLRGAP
jgi:hypothetical protein